MRNKQIQFKQNDFVLLKKNNKKIFCKVLKKYRKYVLLVDSNNKIHKIQIEIPILYRDSIWTLKIQKLTIEFLHNIEKQTILNFEGKISNINQIKNRYIEKTILAYEFYMLIKHYDIKIKGRLIQWILTSITLISEKHTFFKGFKSKSFEKYKSKLNEVIKCKLCA